MLVDCCIRPYYIWLGRSRFCDVTRFCHAFEVEGGNTIGNCSPASLEFKIVSPSVSNVSHDPEPRLPSHDGRSVINITAPLSSFHYQIKKVSSQAIVQWSSTDVTIIALASALL